MVQLIGKSEDPIICSSIWKEYEIIDLFIKTFWDKDTKKSVPR